MGASRLFRLGKAYVRPLGDGLRAGSGPTGTGPDRRGEGGRTGATSAEQRLPIMDHGPCFGMNGHSRRAMDVILRLSRSNNRFSIILYRF